MVKFSAGILDAGPAAAGHLGLYAVRGLMRRYRASPQAARVHRTFGELAKTLQDIGREDAGLVAEAVLRALRTYLGDKLRLSAAALTFKDVEGLLAARGLDAESVQALRDLFRCCEAWRYAGPSHPGDPGALVGQCLEVASRIDPMLK